jgi:hypothetical protein
MKCRQSLYFLITLVVVFNSSFLNAAVVLTGDADPATGKTFTFQVSPHGASSNGDFFYVLASNGNPKNYALSITKVGENKFTPFAPELTRLNNVDNQPNPIYNGNFSYLALMSGTEGTGLSSVRTELPAMVLKAQPSTVYVLDSFFTNATTLLFDENIKDASGSAVTAGIVGLGNVSNVFAAAAVLGNGQTKFGEGDSGIAFLLLNSIKTGEGDQTVTKRELHQIDAVLTTSPMNPTDTRALPVTLNSAAISINQPLESIKNKVSFFWDERLKVLFCAIQITGGALATDGGIAIFKVVAVENNKFILVFIAPAAVFTDPTKDPIIGGISIEDDKPISVSINNIKTMYTSTRLNYLIVQGGQGTPEETSRIVYALPLVNNPNPVIQQGSIANKLENPPTMVNKFGFQTPATTPDEMININDANDLVAAQVGRGPAPSGDIADMFVKNDCVFVSVLNADPNEKPGLFYSQAIMNETTKIVGWTPWQRVNGSVDPVFGAAYDSQGNFIYMTGATIDTIETVKRTVWGLNEADGLLGGTADNASNGFISVFTQKFPRSNGGIQGLFDFPLNTPTLDGISLIIGTGNNTVAIAASGDSHTGNYCPNFGDYQTGQFEFENGTISNTIPVESTSRMLTIKGGDLARIGSITKAEIASDEFQQSPMGYLFVGGTAGLVVLAAPNGSGWIDLTTGFNGLIESMAFKKIGNYSFIRKLYADSGFLYVLTDKQLDRINLAASDFETGTLSVVTLASNTASVPGLDKNDTFIDFIASGKFAVLATSKGIYRIGNGSDVATATNFATADWTLVKLPETVGPVIQMVPITATGRAQDLAKNGGGDLYVLNAYVGKNMGQIYRFSVHDIATAPVDANTFQLFPDFFLAGIPAPLYDFNAFRDLIYTDGSALLHAEDRNLLRDPFVRILFGLQTGVSSQSSQPVPLSLFKASIVQRLMRSSASGAWMVGGDFGIQVSE